MLFDDHYKRYMNTHLSSVEHEEMGTYIRNKCEQLALDWVDANSKKERYDLLDHFGIKQPLIKKYGLRSLAEALLIHDPSVPYPGISESGDLVFALGFPPQIVTPESLISEGLEYQVNAQKEDGKEEVSQWYKDPDTAWEIKKEIDETEDYDTVTVMKRLTSMKEEEDDQGEKEATLEMKTKNHRKGPAGKGKPLGTQVHKDKKKEKSKKAARGKVKKD